MKLFDLYIQILDYAGLSANEEGYISIKSLDNKPSVINGARLVLPYPKQLKSMDANKVVFHPLTENVMRGETDIIKKLRSNINIKLNATIGTVAVHLLRLIASPALHSQLTPEQHELLLHIKDTVDDKTAVNFNSYMLANHETKYDRMFVNIYLTRGGTSNKKYARLGVVSFPFYTELTGDNKESKLRVKDRVVIKQLFEFMFPGLEEKDAYSFGSDSQVAPFLESLMMSSANISSRLNELMDLYSDYIDLHDVSDFNLDWLDDFKNLDALASEIRQIPAQASPETEQPVAPSPVPQRPHVGYVQPQQIQQPHYGYGTPPKQEVTLTKKGIDFKASMGANPSILAAQNMLIPNGNRLMQQQQPQQLAPTWAAPNVPQQHPSFYQQQPQQQSFYQQQQPQSQSFFQPQRTYAI